MNKRKTKRKELKKFIGQVVLCTGTVCKKVDVPYFINYGMNDGNMTRLLLVDLKVNDEVKIDHMWVKSKELESVSEGNAASFVGTVDIYTSIRGSAGYGIRGIRNVTWLGPNPRYEQLVIGLKNSLDLEE